MFKNIFKNIFKKRLNKTKGQAMIEYGLILIISILAAMTIYETQISTQNLIENEISSMNKQNPELHMIKTPKTPTSEDSWNTGTKPSYSHSGNLNPIANFIVQKPAYLNEKVYIWNTSYDPDGQIDTTKTKWECTGCTILFNSGKPYFEVSGLNPKTVIVKLTVFDDNKPIPASDTKVIQVKLTKRENYCRLYADQEQETRTLISESPIFDDGSKPQHIIDHQFGYRTDLYGVEHLVIEKNMYKSAQYKAIKKTYKVSVPVYQVCFDSDGNEISRKLNTENPELVTTEEEKVPVPADITTSVQNNTWTYYVYNERNSVYPKNYSPIYPFFAEKKSDGNWDLSVTQNPAFHSTRESQSTSNLNAGYNVSKCPNCTIPNRFWTNSKSESQTKTLYCSSDSLGYGASQSKTYHTRTENWTTHAALDIYYKYTGSGVETGSMTSHEQSRITWGREGDSSTSGWRSENMVGDGTYKSPRPQYTDCTGDGWSSSCWFDETNSIKTTHSCEDYGSELTTSSSCSLSCSYLKKKTKTVSDGNNCTTGADGKTVCVPKTKTVCYTVSTSYTANGTKYRDYYEQHKRVVTCSFVGDAQSGSTSGSWSSCSPRYTTDWYGCTASCSTPNESCP